MNIALFKIVHTFIGDIPAKCHKIYPFRVSFQILYKSVTAVTPECETYEESRLWPQNDVSP